MFTSYLHYYLPIYIYGSFSVYIRLFLEMFFFHNFAKHYFIFYPINSLLWIFHKPELPCSKLGTVKDHSGADLATRMIKLVPNPKIATSFNIKITPNQ